MIKKFYNLGARNWYNQIHIKPPTVKGTHVLNVNWTELELYEMNLIFVDFVDVWTSENHLQTLHKDYLGLFLLLFCEWFAGVST